MIGWQLGARDYLLLFSPNWNSCGKVRMTIGIDVVFVYFIRQSAGLHDKYIYVMNKLYLDLYSFFFF